MRGVVGLFVWLAAVAAFIALLLREPSEPREVRESLQADVCAVTEPQIRKFWMMAGMKANTEAERVKLAAYYADMFRDICRAERDAPPPTPLPPELARRVR